MGRTVSSLVVLSIALSISGCSRLPLKPEVEAKIKEYNIDINDICKANKDRILGTHYSYGYRCNQFDTHNIDENMIEPFIVIEKRKGEKLEKEKTEEAERKTEEAERKAWINALELEDKGAISKLNNTDTIDSLKNQGYSPSEARRYIDLGIDKFDLSSITYTDRKSEEDKNKVRNIALDKVKENKIADLNKSECAALSAQMIDKDGGFTCNYKELKWDDVKLCSLDLKKAWRENKFTPWQTKQWTDAGVYAPTQRIFDDIKNLNGIGYVIYKKYPECYKKIIENNSDWQRESASNIPEHWDSPNIAQKAFALGIKRQEAYEEWISTEWSQDEIKKWIKFGLSSPDQAKRLKKFGMTVDNAPDYAQAGVSLENLDEYQGMSLEEIQDEKAAEDKVYAEARKKAEKEKSDEISKIRNNIDVIKSGKKYSCGLMQLSYGNNLVTLYDGFYGALEDQLIYIDQTGISKKYIGNKYTVQIITDIKSAKKDLYNAVISKNNGFEMPVYCK